MRIEPNKLFLKTTRPEHIQRESEEFENTLKSFLNEGATRNKDQSSISALVERASLKYGIPKEVITAITSVESGFNPKAYNKNKIELGARILYENYKRFGNWAMAIKAYNGLNTNNWDYVKKVFEKIAEFKRPY